MRYYFAFLFFAEHISKLMARLESCLWRQEKKILVVPQPKTLYSTGEQLPRDEVIAARLTHSRGIRAKSKQQVKTTFIILILRNRIIVENQYSPFVVCAKITLDKTSKLWSREF